MWCGVLEESPPRLRAQRVQVGAVLAGVDLAHVVQVMINGTISVMPAVLLLQDVNRLWVLLEQFRDPG